MIPKISIIVPVYKAELYISRCLDSIRYQTFTDWECILVDDGSPDKSGALCDEYALNDSRFRAFHKINEGVSSTRQFGLDLAKGDFIIHVDPDDWIEPQMLELLYNRAVNQNADLVICDIIKDFKNKSEIISQKPTTLDHNTVLKELFTKIFGSCCNKLVRKICFEKYNISFPQGWSLCEDQYVNASLCLHPIKIAYVPFALYHYVLGENEYSISQVVRQSYEYDVNLFSAFNSLTKGSNVNKLVKSIYAFSVIQREFIRNTSNSLEYSKKTLPYIWLALQAPKPLLIRIKLALSSLGMYRIIRTFSK